MGSSKTYYGETLINVKELIESNEKKVVKLEYYKTKEEIENDFNRYGIEVVKKEYINKKFIQEASHVNRITRNEKEIEGIIEILKRNTVTPIGLVDTVYDLIRKRIAD